MTLLPVCISDKTNEIPIMQAILPLLLAHNGLECIVIADALQTQTALVSTIRARGGYVVLTVKDNQPTLVADLLQLFADPRTPVQTAQTTDVHWGAGISVPSQSREVTTELTAFFLATQSPWQDIASPTLLGSLALSTPCGGSHMKSCIA